MADKQYRLHENKSIVVIPFVNSYQDNEKNIHPPGDNDSKALDIEKKLTNELVSQLKQKKILDIIVLEGNPEALSVNKINADVIIKGRILRYKKRKGSNYAVSYPASVAFEIKLIDPISGNVISHYEYKETQQALSENLFNLKKFLVRKGRWVKAFELASYGISEFVNRYTD